MKSDEKCSNPDHFDTVLENISQNFPRCTRPQGVYPSQNFHRGGSAFLLPVPLPCRRVLDFCMLCLLDVKFTRLLAPKFQRQSLKHWRRSAFFQKCLHRSSISSSSKHKPGQVVFSSKIINFATPEVQLVRIFSGKHRRIQIF